MPQWSDFLERFRPSGTPGAAARPGVPADCSTEAAAELIRLLTLLDDVQDEAQRIRSDAAERAEEICSGARQHADDLVARAHAQARHVQAQAEARTRSEAAPAHTEMRTRTTAEIERLQARAQERMPEYVEEVVSVAREFLEQSPSPRIGAADT